MKFAFMSFSCPEVDFDGLISLAKEYGYDGIEPRIGSGHKHGIELDSTLKYREKCLEKAEEAGISVACIATSCVYADPEKHKQNIQSTNKSIDLAADLKCNTIRVFGGAIPEGMSREQAINNLTEALKQVAEHAEKRKVYVCIETHDDWCNPDHVVTVIEKVNSPFIAVNWDIMHPVRVAKVSIEESFGILKNYIKHCHFHDGITDTAGNLRLCPIGQGEIDHETAVKLLSENRYSGFMSGEWIGWQEYPYTEHLPNELNKMKKFL